MPYLSGFDGVGDGLEARSRRKRLEEEEEAKRLYEEAVGDVSREVSSEEVPAEMPDGMPSGREGPTSAYT